MTDQRKRLYVSKHTRDWVYPIDLWRLGTYWTNFHILRLGRLWSLGITFKGRSWVSPNLSLLTFKRGG